MELCVGIIVLIVVVVGGILVYAQFAAASADKKRIAWARTLDELSLPELEKMRDEMDRKSKTLQKERLLVSGHKRAGLDVELGECKQRIDILNTFINEKK